MSRKVNPRRVERLIHRYAAQAGIAKYAPYLIAQIAQESGFQEGVGSSAGARDIAQFMPGTAKSYGVTLGDNRIKDDLRGQVRMMADLIHQTGNIEDALRGYNAGPGAIEASRGYAQTNNYVAAIKAGAKKYGGAGGAGGGGASRHGGTPGYDNLNITPGVDNSDARRALLAQYLLDRDKPDALLELGYGMKGAQDIPGSASLTAGPRGTQGRGGGGGKGKGRKLDINELFYDPLGFYIDNGKRQQGAIGGHTDHLHVATNNRRDADRVGYMAQRMGLNVSENNTFDKVDPVHTQGSFHYSDRADDISGDPEVIRRLIQKLLRRRRR